MLAGSLVMWYRSGTIRQTALDHGYKKIISTTVDIP